MRLAEVGKRLMMTCRSASAFQQFRLRTAGVSQTTSHRVYLENEKEELVSFFHDLPLFVDEEEGLVNMICEIPKWSNAKLEISTGEAWNPIKQDVKKGKLRFVKNLFPLKGYPWNYGALPQTWEDPNAMCHHTGYRGDKDPIDVLDISDTVATTGQIKIVKVLGVIGLIDEGETDWKIIAIDVNDPQAGQLNDIGDVQKVYPGLLDMTRQWFRQYKIPDGKPENEFAFHGKYMDRAFALRIIQETHSSWENLMAGKIPAQTNDYAISILSKVCPSSGSMAAPVLNQGATLLKDIPQGNDESDLGKSNYGLFPFYN